MKRRKVGEGSERSALVVGASNIISGSYLLEQRAGDTFDLLAIASPQAQAGFSINLNANKSGNGTVGKGNTELPRRRLRGRQAVETKCTILPALTSLDALLALSPSEDHHIPADIAEESAKLKFALEAETQSLMALRAELAASNSDASPSRSEQPRSHASLSSWKVASAPDSSDFESGNADLFDADFQPNLKKRVTGDGSLSGLLTKHRGALRGAASAARESSSIPSAQDDAPTGSDASPKLHGEGQKDSTKDGERRGTRLLTVLEAASVSASPRADLNQERREVCKMLRFFVFGYVGDESAKSARERDQIFNEAIGTRESVRVLYNLWSKLDEDGSGRVDIIEFRDFAQNHMKERLDTMGKDGQPGSGLPAWMQLTGTGSDMPRFISKLCDRLIQILLSKKSSFTLEDMMKIIWPGCQVSDQKEMRKWTKEFAKSVDKKRVKTPELLPSEEFDGLCSVFNFFDEEKSGCVHIEQLTAKGLIYEDQVAAFTKEWDTNGDGSLDLYEFCEMMCPSGYRAHEGAKVGSCKNGAKSIYDEKLECWRRAADSSDSEKETVGDA